VYVGGSFSTAGVSPANNIAKWNTVTSTWSLLGSGTGNGVNREVSALAVLGSDVYAGGYFSLANVGEPILSSGFAKWIGNYTTTPSASSHKTVTGGAGTVIFENSTAVSMNITTTGSGEFNVYRYTDAPLDSFSISGNVSQYRWIRNQLGFGIISDTIRFKLSEIPNNGITTPTNATVYGRTTPGTGLFSVLSTTYDETNDELVAALTNSTFSEFAFGGSDPLPVELTSFNAKAKGNTVELAWETATETKNKGFEIQRKGSDIIWQKAGYVKGNGTSNKPNKYSFSERLLKAGVIVYRLKLLDRDGNFSYSPEIEVKLEVPERFELAPNYPNPFNPTTTIEFTVPATGLATLKVYNSIGQEVATIFNGIAEVGQYRQAVFDGAQFSSGVSFARLQFGGKSLVKKLLMMK